MVTAVKFTISDQPQPIDPLLKNCIGTCQRALLLLLLLLRSRRL